MRDLMVDIETTGLDATDNAMIQLAAVKFDYATGEVGPIFDRCLKIPHGRWWDMDTMAWWKRDKADILQQIMFRGEEPAEVLKAFAEFCGYAPLRMWAKPSHFDYVFVQNYAKQYNVSLPLHFRDTVDMQSFIRGLRGDPAAPAFDSEVDFDGPAHNAIFDAIHQVKVVLAAKANWGGLRGEVLDPIA